jgi:hypothetical protein
MRLLAAAGCLAVLLDQDRVLESVSQPVAVQSAVDQFAGQDTWYGKPWNQAQFTCLMVLSSSRVCEHIGSIETFGT